MKTFFSAALLALATTLPSLAQSADEAFGAEAAKSVPLADMHFHVMPFMSGTEVSDYMDRHGVKWAGGAGIIGPVGPNGSKRLPEVQGALGKRFIFYAGQHAWLFLKKNGGISALEDADSPAFQQALARTESELNEGARVIGEIHVNTLQSAANDLVRHKVRADAPTLKALLALAGKYKRPMNVHAQWDSDTAEQMGALADSSPNATLILAHCGSTASASEIRTFFEKHANAMCDLSFRSSAQLPPQSTGRAAYDGSSLKAEWKQLIEAFPERFMVGIDDVHTWPQYEAVANSIRFGLLANLSPATAEKVAHQNAVRVFGLD